MKANIAGLMGYGAILAGIAALAMFLGAAGYGFEGWAVVAGICTGIFFALGIALLIFRVHHSDETTFHSHGKHH